MRKRYMEYIGGPVDGRRDARTGSGQMSRYLTADGSAIPSTIGDRTVARLDRGDPDAPGVYARKGHRFDPTTGEMVFEYHWRGPAAPEPAPVAAPQVADDPADEDDDPDGLFS